MFYYVILVSYYCTFSSVKEMSALARMNPQVAVCQTPHWQSSLNTRLNQASSKEVQSGAFSGNGVESCSTGSAVMPNIGFGSVKRRLLEKAGQGADEPKLHWNHLLKHVRRSVLGRLNSWNLLKRVLIRRSYRGYLN